MNDNFCWAMLIKWAIRGKRGNGLHEGKRSSSIILKPLRCEFLGGGERGRKGEKGPWATDHLTHRKKRGSSS